MNYPDGWNMVLRHILQKKMANMELMMPKTLEEQKIIGQFFANLDTLITFQQRKSESLKHIKAALLQKMFV